MMDEMEEIGAVVRISSTPDRGKVLLATGHIKSGVIVLEEEPCIQWSRSQPLQLIQAYLDASKSDQDRVMEMAKPGADQGLSHLDVAAQDIERTRRAERDDLARSFSTELSEVLNSRLSASEIASLLLIADINSHCIGIEGDQAGLFSTASKAEHSCNPNCGHGMVGDNMRYFSVREIKAGESISISYIEDMYNTPRAARREILLHQKRFWCLCERCLGLDECGDLQCRLCKKGLLTPLQPSTSSTTSATSTILQTQASNGSDLIIECRTCGSQIPLQEMETRWDEESVFIAQVPDSDATEMSTATSPGGLFCLASCIRDRLSPIHHTGVSVLSELPVLFPTAKECAEAAMNCLSLLECSAVGCVSMSCPRDRLTSHPPCPLLSTRAIQAYGYLFKHDEDLARTVARRYAPWVKLQFGDRSWPAAAFQAAVVPAPRTTSPAGAAPV